MLVSSDICVDEHGVGIQLHVGLIATAFDGDLNANGIRDDLIASGIGGVSRLAAVQGF